MRDDVVKLTQELVKVPSVKGRGRMKEVLEVVERYLRRFEGIGREEFEHNGVPSVLYFNRKTRPEKFRLLLNGHVDVVVAPEKLFEPRLEGDKLYGRGAMDMKGGVAAGVVAFAELVGKVNYPLGLQLTADEEVGGFDGVKWQLEEGVRSEFTIALEPTQLNVAVAAKGVLWVEVEAKGKSAHGAYPWLGDNAVVKLMRFLEEVLQTFPVPEGDDKWKTTCNLAYIKTENETTNKVPDTARARLDVRYVPADKEEVWKKIEMLAEKYPGVVVSKIMLESNHYVDPERKEVKLLTEVIEKVSGRKPKLIKNNGASDVRHFTSQGMAGVEFGAVGEGMHEEGEWVSVKSLGQVVEVLTRFGMMLE